MHKAKQSQDRKADNKKKHRAESDKSSWFAHPSEKSAGKHVFSFFVWFFFLLVLGFSHTCNFLLRTYSYRLTGKNLIGKVSLSHEVPFCLL